MQEAKKTPADRFAVAGQGTHTAREPPFVQQSHDIKQGAQKAPHSE
jgi:hypothetical protein